MSKILRKIRAGRVVFAVVYTPCTAGDTPKARAQKQKASTAAREKLNARTSFQKLERTLAANFDDGDLFVTLTYDDKHLPDSRGKAVRKIRTFLSKLRKARAERGEELHYIYVTEGACPGGRLHHHLVLNSTGTDLEEIRRLWIYGDNVELRRLAFHMWTPAASASAWSCWSCGRQRSRPGSGSPSAGSGPRWSKPQRPTCFPKWGWGPEMPPL